MMLKCLIFITIFIAIQSATIEKRYIPVEVVYDDSAPSYYPGVRNLNEKVQLSGKQLISSQLKIDEAIENGQTNVVELNMMYGNPNGVKNLEEKVQLSQEELSEALKHLPVEAENEGLIQLKSSFSPTEAEQVEEQSDSISLYRQVQHIISSGLDEIKQNINGLPESKPAENRWKQLNQTVQNLLENEQGISGTKQQAPKQFIQNIVNGFQNVTNNFIQGLQNPNPVNGSEDEQPSGPPGFAQNVISTISGGVQQIVNNINGLGGQGSTTNNTVLGDTGSTPRPGNIFSNVINGVQQIFSNNPLQPANNQSDTGTPAEQPNPGNFIQGAITQINQVVSNFVPTPATQAPVEGDEQVETSSRPNPIQIIQGIGNQIGSAINQANPFAPQSTKPPSSEGDEETSSQPGPVQVIQSIGNQIGSVISQVNPFASTAKPPAGSEDEGTSPANFIQNVQQAFQNINPFRPQGGSPSNPVVEGIQNAGNQIQQLAGQGNGSNPIESIGNQIQGAVTGNPLGSLPVIGGSSTEGQKNVKQDEITTESGKGDKPNEDRNNEGTSQVTNKDSSTESQDIKINSEKKMEEKQQEIMMASE